MSTGTHFRHLAILGTGGIVQLSISPFGPFNPRYIRLSRHACGPGLAEFGNTCAARYSLLLILCLARGVHWCETRWRLMISQ